MRALTRCSSLAAALLAVLVAATAHAAGPKPIGTITFVGRPDLAAIPIVDLQWAARNTASFGGGSGTAVGKASFDDFRITKLLDAASPALLELLLKGTTVVEVRIDVAVRRGTTASYVLSTAIITANDRHLADGAGPILQDITLTARAISETVVSPGGTVTTCFDVALNKSCD